MSKVRKIQLYSTLENCKTLKNLSNEKNNKNIFCNTYIKASWFETLKYGHSQLQ